MKAAQCGGVRSVSRCAGQSLRGDSHALPPVSNRGVEKQ